IPRPLPTASPRSSACRRPAPAGGPTSRAGACSGRARRSASVRRCSRGWSGRPPPSAVIDAHAHLTDRRFADDLPDVLDRARKAGIDRVLTAGEDVASSAEAITLARRYDEVRVAVGVHPHRAAAWGGETAARITELASEERVGAVGEIGLGFSRRSPPPRPWPPSPPGAAGPPPSVPGRRPRPGRTPAGPPWAGGPPGPPRPPGASLDPAGTLARRPDFYPAPKPRRKQVTLDA